MGQAAVVKHVRSRLLSLALALLLVPVWAPLEAQGGDSDEAAITRVIQQANSDQEVAIASQDLTRLPETATEPYAHQLTEASRNMIDNGATTLRLVRMDWGPITMAGDSAQATTFETWATDYDDGTTEQLRDRNVYTLIRQRGTWKIQADEHPDLGRIVPDPATNPAPPADAAPSPGSAQLSRNWSGYSATGGNFTDVIGTWTIPEPASHGRFETDAAWVGIGGARTSDLIQAGTQQTVLPTGLIRFETWIETLPQAARHAPLAVHAGDSVTVAINRQSPDTWLVAFKNNTTGATYRQSLFYESSGSSAEWIEEAPSAGRGTMPLDDFGRIEFSAASAVRDQQSLTLAELHARPIAMTTGRGQPLTTVSPIASDGASFTVVRTDVSSERPQALQHAAAYS